MPPLHQRCCIVLVRTKFAGNLGAAARAMANFGVSDLRLVTPEADRLSGEARALASHGEVVLEQARSYPSLSEAVSDCVWVACTSARLGGLFRHQNVLPMHEGMQLGSQYAKSGKIALVFGPEDHGLTNEEVSLCQYLLHIPADSGYPVLNVAQAVAICLYEWFITTHECKATDDVSPPVSAGEQDRMFTHLEEALRAVHFVWGEKGPSVFHALRHLLSRAQPTEVENKLLHGLARQLLWYVEHHPPSQENTKLPVDVPVNEHR